MDIKVQQAAHHERIWGRRTLRLSWRFAYTLERGVSGKSLSTPDSHAEAHSFSAWNHTVDFERLSQPAAHTARDRGLLQSQRVGNRTWGKKEGFLCPSEVLPGSAKRSTTLATRAAGGQRSLDVS